MSSTSRSLETSVIRKRLATTKPTQEGIQGAAHWMLAHKQQFHQIIHEWLAVLKASKPDRRLTLFYICNEIVQTCKRKNALAYKDAYHAILKEAISYARDSSIVANVERILRIWHERNVYNPDFLNELISELKGESAQLNPSVQLPELIDALKHNQKVDTDLEMKRSLIVNVNLDMSSQQIAKLFKDRQQGKALSNQIEECKQSIQEYMHLSSQSITDRSLLIDQLESAFQIYEAQYAESKIVVNAYKNFGARIRHLRNKLQTRMKTLPPPSEILPSDTHPVDMELSDGEDNGSVIEVKGTVTKPHQCDTYIETLISPPSSPQSNNNCDISSIIIPTIPKSNLNSSTNIIPTLLPIESIPLPPPPPSFLIKASKPSSSYNPYTTTQSSVESASDVINSQNEVGSSMDDTNCNNENKDFNETFRNNDNRNDEVVHEPLNERIERILKEDNEKEKICQNLKDINAQKPSFNEVKPSLSVPIQTPIVAAVTSKQQSDNLINNIDINLLKNILQNTRKPILADPDSNVSCAFMNTQNNPVSNENSLNNNNKNMNIKNNNNSNINVNNNFNRNNNNSYDTDESYVPRAPLKMQVKEYNHTKVDEDEFNVHSVNPPPGKLISPLQFLNMYKSHDANHDEDNRFFSDSDDFVQENGTEIVEDFEKGMSEQQLPSENVDAPSNYYPGNQRNDDYYNDGRNPDNYPRRNFRYASRPFTPRTPPAPFRQRAPVFFTPRPFRPPNRFHSPHFQPQQRFQRAKFNRFPNGPS